MQVERPRNGNDLQIDSTPRNYRRIPISDVKNPKFLDYHISNYDIVEWIKFLKIKIFKGVFRRDNLKGNIKKPECIRNHES